MRLIGRILDDLLGKLLPKLLASTNRISPSRGDARELVGVLLELENPRARLSRTETRGKPFSCLGEFLWYMSHDNRLDFIRHYIPAYDDETEDGETIYGGYGPRFFNQRGHDQLQNVINQLRKSSESRRAVIQLFNAEDIADRRKEIPCTCTLQFMIRRNRLHMLTTMRSNDAFIGLPHDVFCFTMIQEVVARTLGCKLGRYRHFVGSLHLYEDDCGAAELYLDELVQPTISMPSMPTGDPWQSLQKLLDAEHRIRNGEEINADGYALDTYWADLVRLLQIFAATGNTAKIEHLKAMMNFKKYTPYIEARKNMKPRKIPPPQQPMLPF